MTFDEYMASTKRTIPHLGSSLEDQIHMAMGISTEANEILDAYKKVFAYGKKLDVVNVREELGDLFWYISNLMRILDIDFEETLQINIDKLKARYPDGFSKDNAVNRDLVKERKILEQMGFDKPATPGVYTSNVNGFVTYDSDPE